MRIAHFSDTHLGYRAYGRLSPTGTDQREADVFQTFQQVLNSIAEHQPDWVIHTGDFFHMVRPSNHTIVQAFNALTQFQKKRDYAPFILIAGNHETPRTSDAGCILRLIGNPEGKGNIRGVFVFIYKIEALQFSKSLELLAVPDSALAEIPEVTLKPQTSAETRILALHGITSPSGNIPQHVFLPELHTQEWTYVALGGYHIHSIVAPNTAYPGSTDYTSSNIWEEAKHPKGWLLIDTDPFKLTFVPVKPARPVYDLPVIDARGLNHREIAELMMKNAQWAPEELPVVRQRIIGMTPSLRKEIPTECLRTLREQSLYYHLDISSSLPDSREHISTTHAPTSLIQGWSDFLKDWDKCPPGLDRQELLQAGIELLKTARDETD